MIRITRHALTAALAAAFLAFAAGGAFAKEYPKCEQNHPGQTDRAQRLLADGDTNVCKAIAKHVVKYSIVKYRLEGLVNEVEIKEAKSEIYAFLKWKLGNPSAIAAQWVTAGYKHFDKAYSDEAAAAVLGSNLPGPGAELKLPRELSSWLKAKVDSIGAGSEGEASLCDQLTGGGEAAPAAAQGTDEQEGGNALLGVGCELTLAAVKEAIKLAIDRIGISLSAGRSWDIPNRSVELMVYARLHPVKKGGLAQVTKGLATKVPPNGVKRLPTRIGH